MPRVLLAFPLAMVAGLAAAALSALLGFGAIVTVLLIMLSVAASSALWVRHATSTGR